MFRLVAALLAAALLAAPCCRSAGCLLAGCLLSHFLAFLDVFQVSELYRKVGEIGAVHFPFFCPNPSTGDRKRTEKPKRVNDDFINDDQILSVLRIFRGTQRSS